MPIKQRGAQSFLLFFYSILYGRTTIPHLLRQAAASSSMSSMTDCELTACEGWPLQTAAANPARVLLLCGYGLLASGLPLGSHARHEVPGRPARTIITCYYTYVLGKRPKSGRLILIKCKFPRPVCV